MANSLPACTYEIGKQAAWKQGRGGVFDESDVWMVLLGAVYCALQAGVGAYSSAQKGADDAAVPGINFLY